MLGPGVVVVARCIFSVNDQNHTRPTECRCPLRNAICDGWEEGRGYKEFKNGMIDCTISDKLPYSAHTTVLFISGNCSPFRFVF